MAPLLSLMRNPWIGIIIFVVILFGIQELRVKAAQSRLLNCESNFTQQVAAYRQAEAEGQEAARRAVEAAVAREREEALRRVQAEQEAAERLREAAKAAQREADEWRTRFRTAQREDASCAAWVREAVRCPVE